MDQIPVPIAAAPPASQANLIFPWLAFTRPAMSSAAYDASPEISTDTATR